MAELRKIFGRVPEEVATRVSRIAATITETLPHAAALDGARQDLWVLAKTAIGDLHATAWSTCQSTSRRPGFLSAPSSCRAVVATKEGVSAVILEG